MTAHRKKVRESGKAGLIMDEWKHGELHSGSKNGPIVTSRKQAEAIVESYKRKHK